MAGEEGDISNKTIVVLVLLTVLISVLSTLVVLNEILTLKYDSSGQAAEKSSQSASGQVKLEITERPKMSSGMVALEITNNADTNRRAK